MFIVIEGLDGAGKSTQVRLLQKYFDTNGIENFFLHFPRFDAPIYGELIAAFLRGEFGDVTGVDPRLVALLYAGDRNEAGPMIKDKLRSGTAVISDRYVYSNIAFQCAKISDGIKREELRRNILYMEYEHFAIPLPDLNIFLDVPFEFTEKKLSQRRIGVDRSYLQGKKDIHESDLDLQKRVREIYIQQAESDEKFRIIDCMDENSKMKNPRRIHNEIIDLLSTVRK